jgi:site-specific recombinase XerD
MPRLYQLKTEKNEDGLAPIVIFYYRCKPAFKKSTEIWLHVDNWDNKESLIINMSDTKKKAEIMKTLRDKLSVVRDAVYWLKDNEQEVSRKSIMDIANRSEEGKSGASQRISLNNLFTFFLKNKEQSGATENTLKAYRIAMKFVQSLEKDRGKIIYTDDIANKIADEIRRYAISKGLSNNSIKNYASRISNVLQTAWHHDLIDSFERSRFLHIATKNLQVINVEKIAITGEEYGKLYNMEMEDKDFDVVRRAFLFSCISGIRYNDLKSCKHRNIVSGHLNFVSSKRKVRVSMPVTDLHLSLIFRGNDEDYLFPDLPTEPTWKLKQLGRKIGMYEKSLVFHTSGANVIEKEVERWERLSFHVSRHTFSTMLQLVGIPEMVWTSLMGLKSGNRIVGIYSHTTKEVARIYAEKAIENYLSNWINLKKE